MCHLPCSPPPLLPPSQTRPSPPAAAAIRAATDRATPANLFSHPYFNLAGLPGSSSTVLDHVLTLPTA